MRKRKTNRNSKRTDDSKQKARTPGQKQEKRKQFEHILILNIGSSSIKYDLFRGEQAILKGLLERVHDHTKGITKVMSEISKRGLQVDAAGHRVVHGGSHTRPAILNAKKIKELEKISELAPLHNKPELKGIKACAKILRKPQAALFDTAFHQSIPEKAHTYALPSRLCRKHGIRRYGFHGTSHDHAAREAARMMMKPIRKSKIITCHLGNGCSVCAVENGRSIDTSMGFTPLEGLVMGTRSGDIDPAIIPFLQAKERLNPRATEKILNHESGLLGLCGRKDMRDIHAASENDRKARLAQDIFCYRLIKYIGAYIAAMDGVHAIVFTGGIGENAWWIREEVLRHFRHIGFRLDRKANRNNSHKISSFTSRVWAFVIPAEEELMMCRQTRELLEKQQDRSTSNPSS